MPTWQIQTADGGSTRVDGDRLETDYGAGMLSVVDGDEVAFMAPLSNLAYVKLLQLMSNPEAVGSAFQVTLPEDAQETLVRQALRAVGAAGGSVRWVEA